MRKRAGRAAGLGWALLLSALPAAAAELPEGYWLPRQTTPILEKTLRLRLAPDLSMLSGAEREALDRLLQVGILFQDLYERSRHHQAAGARARLAALHEQRGGGAETQALLDLYRLFRGPIAVTLDNERVPFLPVDPVVPGKNVYPWGTRKAAVAAFLDRRPERAGELLHVRSVVRRATRERLSADLAVLAEHPGLSLLQPGLEARLREMLQTPDEGAFYAVPYSVAYAEELLRAHALLWEAAALVEAGDSDFADYLRHRARDLLANDYEAGDAAWVRGAFGRMNAQIGAYETYDDELFGVKSFFSASLLVRDQGRSRELRSVVEGLQAIEDALPYARHKKTREDIPIGVYNVVADFGQARGTNTATILPNESHIARKYGRTILLRYNVMTHPELFAIARTGWSAAMAPEHHDDLEVEGNFDRTLWHEIGHYLGPDGDPQGRPLGEALQENSDLIEEMKADLVSLFSAGRRARAGDLEPERLRSIYASGIRRVLQTTRPRRQQPYQTMQLMQMNYFLESGLLEFEAEQRKLRVHYERYPEVVESLLREVLRVQSSGDKAASDAFVVRYSGWEESLHGVLARAMQAAETYRYRLVRYAALGE